MGPFLLGPGGWPHLGTWTNLLGGWELDKVLTDPRRFSTCSHTENPNSMYFDICLLVGLIFLWICMVSTLKFW